MKNNLPLQQKSASLWLKKLEEADFSTLGLSLYHTNYIKRLQAYFPHYFSIYRQSFALLFQNYSETEIENTCGQDYFIDYGGGCGFLSLYARVVMGIEKIIYVDTNEGSTQVVAQIFDYFALAKPDILLGNQNELTRYCKEKQITPTYLVSTDVIEHIYNLDLFFADLQSSFPKLSMIFSTGSNPQNHYIRKKLQRYMIEDELRGDDNNKAFLAQRKIYIEKHFNLNPYENLQLAIRTRGLIFEDIHTAVLNYQETKFFPLENPNPQECCDPNTGSWTERILSFQSYKHILHKHTFEVRFSKGYYDEQRNTLYKSIFFKLLNSIIRFSGHLGYFISPYIYLKIQTKK